MYSTFEEHEHKTSDPVTDENTTAIDEDDPLHIDMKESEWCKCGRIKISLTLATVIAAILGGAIGVSISLHTTLSSNSYKIIILVGDLWIRALKLLVLPLLSLMMIVLPSRVDVVGSVGKQCVPLYIFTSLCAAIEGTAWVWLIKPGNFGDDYIDSDTDTDTTEDLEKLSELDAFLNVFYGIAPENIIVAMSELSVFGIIVFFLALGVLLRDVNIEEKEVVLKFCNAILKCVMKAIVYVIWLTPFGMLSLITAQMANTDDIESLLKAIGVWLLCLIIGLWVHVSVFYPLLLWFATRPIHGICYGFKFLGLIYEAPLLAFATSSSAAALPRSLIVAKEKADIRSKIAQFVLPLGSAINMDGGALYYPIAVGFIAQLHDEQLSMSVIAITCLLSVTVSVGTAPIPIGASMVYILMLLKAAGLEKYETEAIGTLFIFEWFCDRIRTAVNVASDLFVAKISDDVHKNAEKKNRNIVCSCFYGKSVTVEDCVKNGSYDEVVETDAKKSGKWVELTDDRDI